MLLRLLEERAPLPVTADQVEAVDLELVPGFLRDVLHVPFQQAREIMDDLPVAVVGVAGAQRVCFGEDLKHTDIGTS